MSDILSKEENRQTGIQDKVTIISSTYHEPVQGHTCDSCTLCGAVSKKRTPLWPRQGSSRAACFPRVVVLERGPSCSQKPRALSLSRGKPREKQIIVARDQPPPAAAVIQNPPLFSPLPPHSTPSPPPNAGAASPPLLPHSPAAVSIAVRLISSLLLPKPRSNRRRRSVPSLPLVYKHAIRDSPVMSWFLYVSASKGNDYCR